MSTETTKKVLIVGAGPVGSLTALTFHKRGWQVEIWEGRDDPRGTDVSPANLRSINLAISSRGLEALKSVDPSLAEELLRSAIPMKGRMIHHTDGRQESQLYDPSTNQCINSLPRPLLNLRLIQALPTDSDRMTIKFDTKLQRIDWAVHRAYGRQRVTPSDKKGNGKPGEEREQSHREGELSGKGKDETRDVTADFDLVVGCDGSWSKVRQEMMKVERVDFSQSFIPHAYIELHMPPSENQETKFKIDEHHLHIWPRHSFMLIGLPNQDGSFTLTLFAPFSAIEALQTRAQAEAFFDEHFPTAVDWVGRERVVDDFMKAPRGKLVTINASPSHHDSKALLLGDSSHSMVPFYGQGLNCGLEDVRVLNCMLEKHAVTSDKTPDVEDQALAEALSEYSEIRGADLQAICELAMENYTEMRSSVLTPMHHLRRVIDSCLSRLFIPTPYTPLSTSTSSTNSTSRNTVAFPTSQVRGWSSLYSMVTFRPDVSYREALRKERSQREIVAWMGRGVVGAAVGAVGIAGYKGLQLWGKRRSL